MKNTHRTKNTFAGIAAVAMAIVLSTLSLTGCDSPVDPPELPPVENPTVINIAAIEGVTIPATGETPVYIINYNVQYSGTVTWNGNPPADSVTFAPSTVYTATITLTERNGFTLQGVTANFFTVAEAVSVSNAANSGVITAVFPATGGTVEKPTIIDIREIKGITIPAPGEIPVTSITENAQYTGTVTWNGNPSTFAPSTVYTATITLTAKTGYTLQGVPADCFIVAGATATNAANSGVITAEFLETIGPIYLSEVLSVTFTGPTERVITVTKNITTDFSISGGGSITLSIAAGFDKYEWFIGETKAASGNSVTLQAGNAAFVPGNNWITAVVYDGAAPWSGEFAVWVNE